MTKSFADGSGEKQNMTLTRLRWVTIVLPILFIIVFELVEDLLLEPVFGRWVGHLITFVAVGIGAAALPLVVFQTVEQVEGRLRRQNRDLAAVNGISRVVSGSLDLDTILRHALDKVLEAAEAEAAEIFCLTKRVVS
jgi:hypothetical protein